MRSISDNGQLTEDMIQYEEETGKKAIWQGAITEGFKKWQEGERIYGKHKKGIGILVSEKTKARWQKFTDENNISTLSKLIRQAVDYYIDIKSKNSFLKDISILSHDLKEPLTSIKGFSQLIIENKTGKLDLNVLLRIKEIYAQSVFLENKINDILRDIEPEISQYDILIIEDDNPTIMVLSDFFEIKGYSCIGVTTGAKGLEELNRFIPKLILLDIRLPDLSGYEICNTIKNNEKLKNVPIFYITAIPEKEVSKKLKETGANGFLLKPFNFNELKILFNYLNR